MELPTIVIDCDDRFAVPMLQERCRLLEEHGLMGLAREVSEQAELVRRWQVERRDSVKITSLTITDWVV